MNNKIYSQLDSRWSGKPYPTRYSTFGGNGCGCVSCTHIAIEQSSKKSWTPETLRPWMVSQGFAVSGKGTMWDGITETLEYLGHKKIVRIYYADPMSKAWKELNKKNRIGIILFQAGKGPNGTVWTTSGHYVAFTDYKYQNGKHYFYMKDSGGRRHSGWYTYENSMKNCISQMWIVERLNKNYYTGKYPHKTISGVTSDMNDTKAWQTFLNWYGYTLDVDGIFGAKSKTKTREFQQKNGLKIDGIVGPKTIAKAKEIGIKEKH